MDKTTLNAYQEKFQKELFSDCLPFWKNYGEDQEKGGIYSYLTAEGERYSTVKSVWIQGRYMWLMSQLCNQYGKQDGWLSAAKSCGEFLDKNCFDKDGRMYFQVTGDGRPVRKRRYFFSEAFYIMGFSEYAKATGDREYLEKARKVYDMVLRIYTDPSTDPHQVYPKYEPETFRYVGLGGPMIMLNVTNVMRQNDPENIEVYDAGAKEYIHDVVNKFYRPELKCVLENVTRDGETVLDTPLGRLVSPGHSIEAAWFLFNEAKYFGDDELMEKALNILQWSLDIGWDQDHGGIVYFSDIKNYPPEQYEHDMKLWLPHCEAVIAVLMAYQITKDKKWSDWFEKLVDYSFENFKNKEGLEWVGYLLHDNTKQQPISMGNSFKGPFHLPRMLIECDRILGELQQ